MADRLIRDYCVAMPASYLCVFASQSHHKSALMQMTVPAGHDLGQECFRGSKLAFHQSSKRPFKRYLEPADRLQEVLCGLIMVLEFTLIGGLTVGAEKNGVRILLIGAIGCNITWGIIDGVLYAMGNLTARRERLRFLNNLRNAPDENTAFSIISGKVDPLLEPATSAADRARICHTLLPVMSRIQLPEGGIVKDDVIGMIAVFLLNVVSVVPAIIPFLVVSQPHRALRISNALLIASLFAVGFTWGKYIHVNRYVTAGCAVLIGLVLVGIAIALGG